MAGWYKEQIGPLPAGAWVAVVGGGLGIAMWSRRHPAPAKAVDTAVAPSADLGPTALPDYSTGGGGSSSPSPMTPPLVTNGDWQRVASSALILHGFDPLTVTRALTDYLSGNALDAKETAAVEEALREVGPPPLPPPNPSGSVSTTPPPSTAPPPPASITGILDQGFYGVGFGPLTATDWQKGLTESPIASTSGKYEWLPNALAVQAATASGQPIYYEPVPGVFARAEGLSGTQWRDTPIYVKAA